MLIFFIDSMNVFFRCIGHNYTLLLHLLLRKAINKVQVPGGMYCR